jgi:RAD51-like protein 3
MTCSRHSLQLLLFVYSLLSADLFPTDIHSQTNSPSAARIRIIVIDSITPLLGPMLSAVSSQGHAIMTTFMRQLRALSQAFELCIFVSYIILEMV